MLKTRWQDQNRVTYVKFDATKPKLKYGFVLVLPEMQP